jgi:hypothetical protein
MFISIFIIKILKYYLKDTNLNNKMQAEQSTVEQVEQVIVEQVIVEQATVEQPIVEQATVEQATVEQATVEQATVEQATVEQATVEQATVEQPIVEHVQAKQLHIISYNDCKNVCVNNNELFVKEKNDQVYIFNLDRYNLEIIKNKIYISTKLFTIKSYGNCNGSCMNNNLLKLINSKKRELNNIQLNENTKMNSMNIFHFPLDECKIIKIQDQIISIIKNNTKIYLFDCKSTRMNINNVIINNVADDLVRIMTKLELTYDNNIEVPPNNSSTILNYNNQSMLFFPSQNNEDEASNSKRQKKNM